MPTFLKTLLEQSKIYQFISLTMSLQAAMMIAGEPNAASLPAMAFVFILFFFIILIQSLEIDRTFREIYHWGHFFPFLSEKVSVAGVAWKISRERENIKKIKHRLLTTGLLSFILKILLGLIIFYLITIHYQFQTGGVFAKSTTMILYFFVIRSWNWGKLLACSVAQYLVLILLYLNENSWRIDFVIILSTLIFFSNLFLFNQVFWYRLYQDHDNGQTPFRVNWTQILQILVAFILLYFLVDLLFPEKHSLIKKTETHIQQLRIQKTMKAQKSLNQELAAVLKRRMIPKEVLKTLSQSNELSRTQREFFQRLAQKQQNIMDTFGDSVEQTRPSDRLQNLKTNSEEMKDVLGDLNHFESVFQEVVNQSDLPASNDNIQDFLEENTRFEAQKQRAQIQASRILQKSVVKDLQVQLRDLDQNLNSNQQQAFDQLEEVLENISESETIQNALEHHQETRDLNNALEEFKNELNTDEYKVDPQLLKNLNDLQERGQYDLDNIIQKQLPPDLNRPDQSQENEWQEKEKEVNQQEEDFDFSQLIRLSKLLILIMFIFLVIAGLKKLLKGNELTEDEAELSEAQKKRLKTYLKSRVKRYQSVRDEILEKYRDFFHLTGEAFYEEGETQPPSILPDRKRSVLARRYRQYGKRLGKVFIPIHFGKNQKITKKELREFRLSYRSFVKDIKKLID